MSAFDWEAIASNALGSAGAGILSRLLTHPLDTAKARLQAVGITYNGPVDVLRRTIATEGIRGLYRGFSTVIVGGTPGTIIYLCSYDIFKERIAALTDPDQTNASDASFAVHFASGLSAEAVACLIYVPVDVIKERLQVQHANQATTNYKGGGDALVRILRTEGLSGIYKGYGATLLSFGPFSALYFVFYEKFKNMSKSFSGTEVLSTPWLILSSSGAGALASFLTSPLDLAKLRLQVQRGQAASNGPKYRGVVDCLVHAFREGGFPGLFRGAGARVLHFVPATSKSTM
eukprot:Nitzschia sp. Nitz4//scaffold13_size275219//56687//57844//NITZ4_000851-RA/size275219-exonerate_protein2genome-gene-0.43-mRNA-1//-1//CDS//3329535945//4048//frame0